METRRKSSGSSGAVLEGRLAGSRCGDCAKGSIGDWQQAGRGARGLAGIVATGGRSAGAAGDPLGDLAGHPAAPFATADLSVFPSGNHLVRFPVRAPGFADTSGVAGPGSFGGQGGLVVRSLVDWRTSRHILHRLSILAWFQVCQSKLGEGGAAMLHEHSIGIPRCA